MPAVKTADQATLTFAAAGALTGSTGCNQFGGTYVQERHVPDDHARSHDAEGVRRPSGHRAGDRDPRCVVQGRLVLSGQVPHPVGQRQVHLAHVRRGAPRVSRARRGTQPASTTARAAYDASADTEKVTAVFAADGKLTGTGGCNTYNTTYTTTDSNGLTLGQIASTAMACAGQRMQIEQEYFADLARSRPTSVRADELTLKDSGGATQVTYALAGG